MSQQSKFVLGQMAQWLEELSVAGRTEHLFELEMWLRSFDRYFRVSNQPLSTDARRALAIRSFYEEIGLVAQAIKRVTQLCTLLASEDRVGQERFHKYVDNYLRKDDVVDPYIARLLRQASPKAGLALLRESFEDLHLILTELTGLARIPYATFQSVGRLVYREVHRNEYLSLMMEKKGRLFYDRIGADPIAGVIRGIEHRELRLLVAKVFLELFRLLRYLDFADPRRRRTDELRTTVLIFTLIASETRALLAGLREKEGIVAPHPELAETVEGFIYCIPLELRKVFHNELTDFSALRQADTIYVRIENSHGILRDCFQQSVVQLAQVFRPELRGADVFAQFATRLEQTLALRDDLIRLITAVHRFGESPSEESARAMKALAAQFHTRSLRHLMYRDWSSFESFHGDLHRCGSLTGLVQIAHRFETYLRALLQEVSKRGVLQGQRAAGEPSAHAER